MGKNNRWFFVVLIIASGSFVACSTAAGTTTEEREKAANAQTVDGVVRVTLSEKAAERLGIQTAPVVDAAESTPPQRIVPYSAVMYDSAGETFVYTESASRVFAHAAITVARINGDTAVLSDGPPAGTNVVTVGAPELYGAESGLGDENPE